MKLFQTQNLYQILRSDFNFLQFIFLLLGLGRTRLR
uniref:Uncharacterized protein n=1 Tax=Rhizophora mucronata TaxID=61149 RepID=A0A2P2NQD9_RHIMU